MRAPGVSFWRMPLLVWANFSTSLLVVIATPFVARRSSSSCSTTRSRFNFFVHEAGRRRADVPARLLVLLAPGGLRHGAAGLGIISEVLSIIPQAIFGYRMMAFSLLAIVLLGSRCGTPHVRLQRAELDPVPWWSRPDRRRADQDQDLLLAGDAVAGVLHVDTAMLWALGS